MITSLRPTLGAARRPARAGELLLSVSTALFPDDLIGRKAAVIGRKETVGLEHARATSGRSHAYDQWLKVTLVGRRSVFQAIQEPDISIAGRRRLCGASRFGQSPLELARMADRLQLAQGKAQRL